MTEFLAVDHGKLQLYLGASSFDDLGRRYAAEYSQLAPGLRWFSRNLPTFLGKTAPYSRSPELAELARLEAALNAAFEAPDMPVLTLSELGLCEAHGLDHYAIQLHPSAQRLCFNLNTTSLWAALKCAEVPPRPERLDVPQQLIVWRQGTQPRFRMLGEDEARMLDLALEPVPFSQLVDAFVPFGNADGSAASAANYLRGWVSAELVSAARILKAAGEK